MLYIPRRLYIKDIISVAYNTSRVNLSKIFAHNIQRTREYIEKISGEEKTIYGVTTGVGALATKKISVQVKKSQELYEEMKSVLKQIDVDGMFIEMCNAISRWEEMDYYLVNIRDYYTERAFVKAGKILD